MKLSNWLGFNRRVPKPAERVAVVVLGTHRSGTSALTRMISLLGATLPQHLMAANAANEAGYWEPVRLADLHDRMLREAGSHWSDWRAFDINSLPPDRAEFYRTEIRRLVQEEYGDANLIVLKEPRVCRFVSLYDQILSDLGYEPVYVLTNRHPVAIVASLEKRDRMSPDFASLMTLRNVVDAERDSRHRRRACVSYEALVTDPIAVLASLTSSLDIEWPHSIDDRAAEIAQTLRGDLRHHRPEPSEVTGVEWLNEASLAMNQLSVDPSDRQVLRKLDRIHREFEDRAAQTGLLAKTLAQTFLQTDAHQELRVALANRRKNE